MNETVENPVSGSTAAVVASRLNLNSGGLWVMRSLLVIADVAISLVALYLAYLFVFSYIDWEQGAVRSLWEHLWLEWQYALERPDQGFGPYLLILPFVPVIRVLTAWRMGLYEIEGELDTSEDLVDVFRSVTIGTILLIVFTFCYRDALNYQGSYSPHVFFWDWVWCLVLMVFSRLGVRQWQLVRRRHGKDLHPVIVIGNNPVATMLHEEIKKNPEIGYSLVEQLTLGQTDEDMEHQLQRVPELVRQHDVRDIFIASTRLSQYQVLSLMMSLEPHHNVSIRLLPDLLGCFPRKVRISQLGNVPMLELFTEPIRGLNRTLKRALDVVVALAALLVLMPVLIAAALAIKLTSKGPVLFKQTRIGLDCRPFTMFKLRTMYTDADHDRHKQFMERVIREGGVKTADGQVRFKEEDDPRITPVGRVLRRYSIDEIPQFFNVLRGEMSVVGPRPPIAYEVERYKNYQKGRLSAKPGITGVWQVSGRNAISFEEMVKMDIAYMEHWSLWGDIKIILRTVPVVLFGKDAY